MNETTETNQSRRRETRQERDAAITDWLQRIRRETGLTLKDVDREGRKRVIAEFAASGKLSIAPMPSPPPETE